MTLSPGRVGRCRLRFGGRGVIVTTVHKFRDAAADLSKRDNVIVMVDEAHRSQEGDLGIYMRAALPEAKLFAFTGTPVESTDLSTRRAFSPEIDGERENYLDAYRIKEAIDDGATVPIVYEARMPQWAVRVEDLDETFEHEFADLTEGAESGAARPRGAAERGRQDARARDADRG